MQYKGGITPNNIKGNRKSENPCTKNVYNLIINKSRANFSKQFFTTVVSDWYIINMLVIATCESDVVITTCHLSYLSLTIKDRAQYSLIIL